MNSHMSVKSIVDNDARERLIIPKMMLWGNKTNVYMPRAMENLVSQDKYKSSNIDHRQKC